MLTGFRRTAQKDKSTARLQDAADVALRPITTKAILDGALITGVQLISGSATNVAHKLGRRPLGYIVVAKSANANVWDSPPSADLVSSFLVLNCSANVTVSLWVF